MVKCDADFFSYLDITLTKCFICQILMIFIIAMPINQIGGCFYQIIGFSNFGMDCPDRPKCFDFCTKGCSIKLFIKHELVLNFQMKTVFQRHYTFLPTINRSRMTPSIFATSGK